jgi:hypothetical protein
MNFARVGLVPLALLAAFLIAASSAQAAPAQEFRFPIETDGFTCNGNTFHYVAENHIVMHSEVTPSGTVEGLFHFDQHGVGITDQGVEYTLSGTETSSQQFFAALGSEFTLVTQAHFIRRGEPEPTDDFLAFFITHVTVSANGDVTADFSRLDLKCT